MQSLFGLPYLPEMRTAAQVKVIETGGHFFAKMQTESNSPQVEGGMIVNFPRQAAFGADTSPARAPPIPQVRFSQYSQLTVILPNDVMKSKWISRAGQNWE